MSGLKHLRGRIKSIKSTQKITKAMQMVAASKLKKIKDLVTDSSHYLDAIKEIMIEIAASNMLQDLSPKEQKFFSNQLFTDKEASKLDLFIIFTSERGLCGSFNSSIIKKTIADITDSEKQGRRVKLVIIGKKGYDILKNRYHNYIDSYFNYTSVGNNEELLLTIKSKIIDMMGNGKIDACYLYFNKFKNTMIQVPVKECLLPVEPSKEKASNVFGQYEYEGDGVIPNMINLYVNGQMNFAFLQSRASEEGARMTAMDNSTKNASDIIDKLTLKLNRSRQAIITKELIEIISGAEAL